METTRSLISTTGVVGKIPAIGVPVAIIVASGVLAVQPELRLAVPLLVGMTALISVLLAFSCHLGEQGRLAWSPTVILVTALVLRIMFLFAPPQLSDDIYRYLWDGSTLLRGGNPYAAAPSTVKPPTAMAVIHSRINHPQYVTIYPPTAQLVFAAGSLNGTITGLKAFLVLIDLGLCALVILLLKQLEMPAWRAVLYAWNPLAVIEIAGSGHVDGAGLALLIGSVCLLVIGTRRSVRGLRHWQFFLSGVLLAGAGLVKLFPFILLPVLLLVPAERRRYFIAGFLSTLAALVLPFLPQLANILDSLNTYACPWEFAGFAFSIMRAVTGSGTISRLVLSASFLVAVVVIVLQLARSLKHEPAPVCRGRQAMGDCYAIAMALLLLTPTLQPWYALCLAVFLPFCAGPAGLVLCWAVFLTYQVQIHYFTAGKWIENPYVTGAVFLAPVTAYLLSRSFKTVRQATTETGQ